MINYVDSAASLLFSSSGLVVLNEPGDARPWTLVLSTPNTVKLAPNQNCHLVIYPR